MIADGLWVLEIKMSAELDEFVITDPDTAAEHGTKIVTTFGLLMEAEIPVRGIVPKTNCSNYHNSQILFYLTT